MQWFISLLSSEVVTVRCVLSQSSENVFQNLNSQVFMLSGNCQNKRSYFDTSYSPGNVSERHHQILNYHEHWHEINAGIASLEVEYPGRVWDNSWPSSEIVLSPFIRLRIRKLRIVSCKYTEQAVPDKTAGFAIARHSTRMPRYLLYQSQMSLEQKKANIDTGYLIFKLITGHWFELILVVSWLLK